MATPLEHSTRVLTDALQATKAQLADREAHVASPRGALHAAHHATRIDRMRAEIADLELGLLVLSEEP